MRILVADDDAEIRSSLAMFLDVAFPGCEVLLAPSAESALDAATDASARGCGFDVLLTDQHMGGMTGVELASCVMDRALVKRGVLLSGDPDAGDALDRGRVEFEFLRKPFEPDALVAAIEGRSATRRDRRNVVLPGAEVSRAAGLGA